MTYYRMAFYQHQPAQWAWKSTALTSLQAVIQWLRMFSAYPQGHIRVFTAASKEELQKMLRLENTHLPSGSVTAVQFLSERKLQLSEQAYSSVAYHAMAPEVRQTSTSLSLRARSKPPDFPGSSIASPLERRRLELESGPGGDHDTPYHFTLPIPMQQLHAWIRLQSRVQVGE